MQCLNDGKESRNNYQHKKRKNGCFSKASILQRSAFFTVQLSHPYMTTGRPIALTRWTFVGKVISLLFNMLSGWEGLMLLKCGVGEDS